MPWKLENQNQNIVKYLLPSVIYTIGRVSADVILTHMSISRKHASLIWKCDLNYIQIEDYSKFDGDIVTFGAQPGVDLNCSFVDFDIVYSTLSNEDHISLMQYMSIIGGNLLENLDDKVKFLVMSNLKVTFKTVCALIKQIKIVKVDFVNAMAEYFKGITQSLPDPDHYLPEINISNDSLTELNYKPNLKRKSLFNNKKFYFLTREKLSRFNDIVMLGGGIVILLTDSDLNDKSLREKLANSDSIVMQETVKTNLVNKISFILKGINKRLINDSEIGFAVMFASTDVYCNPCESPNRQNNTGSNSLKSTPLPSIEKLPLKSEPPTNNNKRMYNDSFNGIHEYDTNVIDLDNKFDRDHEQIITIIDTDSESDNNSNANQDSLGMNKENYSPKSNLPISKFLNISVTNLPAMKTKFVINNNDEFNDDFDNISIPGLQSIPGKPVNTLIQEPTRNMLNNVKDEKQNTSNIFPRKRKISNTTDKSASSSKKQKVMQTIKLITDKQLFDQQLISLIPTKIQINLDNEMDIKTCPINVKFAQLVKENYFNCKNFKIFRKKTPIYIECNPVPLVLFR